MKDHMPTDKLLFLDEEQVKAVLSYDELIPAIRQALVDFSSGRVVQPLRTVMSVAAHGGWFAVMPAVYGDVMGAKMVTFYPKNVAFEKHTHMAMIQLFRADTGEPLAMMDGRLITEMRTAAVSAVAVDRSRGRRRRCWGFSGAECRRGRMCGLSRGFGDSKRFGFGAGLRKMRAGLPRRLGRG
jgi:ornithine cyclodeaminase/alanine dehydrogenase-like protein (mu-crystallin family)